VAILADVPDGGSSLSIGEVAERTGLSVHALRFYEREGILPDPVQRNLSGHRVYSEDHVEWLAICKSLRASGMPLAEIRDYVVLIKQGAGNEHERLALLRRHQASLTAQIDQLRECFAWIEYKAGIYETHLAQNSARRLALARSCS
jgi:DNA-binding transcriptional MerR regulator